MFFLRSNSVKLPECPRRILLIQLGSVGEMIEGLPLLVTLRMRFPYSEIAYLVEESTVPILAGHSALNRIFIAKKRSGRSNSQDRFLRNRLRLFNPDITIDLHGNARSTSMAWASGSKHRIGFSESHNSLLNLKKGNRFLNNIRVTPQETHNIDRNLQLMELFGVQGCSVAFDLCESEICRYRANEILGYVGLHGRFVLFNLGANHTNLRWPKERFAKLARYLENQWNLPSLVVWYGDEEYAAAKSIVHSSGGAAVLSPYAPLNELASIARSATVLVSADAPLLHVGGAVGTHCLGLFGGTSALKGGPYGLRNHAIQALNSSPLSTHVLKFESGANTIQTHAATETDLGKKSKFLMSRIETSTVCKVCDEMLNEILHSKSVVSAESLEHRMVLHLVESRSDREVLTRSVEPKAA